MYQILPNTYIYEPKSLIRVTYVYQLLRHLGSTNKTKFWAIFKYLDNLPIYYVRFSNLSPQIERRGRDQYKPHHGETKQHNSSCLSFPPSLAVDSERKRNEEKKKKMVPASPSGPSGRFRLVPDARLPFHHVTPRVVSGDQTPPWAPTSRHRWHQGPTARWSHLTVTWSGDGVRWVKNMWPN